MYPEVSEYILQKVLTCPKCLKTHNHFSNFKDSCLKTCLNNKFPICKSIKKIVCKRKKCEDKKHVSLLRYLIHVDKQHGYLEPYVARCSKCSEEFKNPNVYLKHSCNPDPSEKTLLYKPKSVDQIPEKVRTRIIPAKQPHTAKQNNSSKTSDINCKIPKEMPCLGSNPIRANNKEVLDRVSKETEYLKPKTHKKKEQMESLMSQLFDVPEISSESLIQGLIIPLKRALRLRS